MDLCELYLIGYSFEKNVGEAEKNAAPLDPLPFMGLFAVTKAAPDKYAYSLCMELRLLGSRRVDAARISENVVYLELLRNGYDVYVGKIDEFETDFVSQKGKETLYYQVALTVRDENTLKRELRPLTAAKDRYPKFVLTLDDDPEMQYDGISIMNARDWLPEKTD